MENFELKKNLVIQRPDVLAIGSSTGGLKALETVFTNFKGGKLNIPIFITQHTPKNFDQSIVDKIVDVSGLKCELAKNGELVESGKIYVAPSGFHLTIKLVDNQKIIELIDTPPVSFCKPSVDVMLDSLVNIYQGKIMVVILTGIGSDGTSACKKISDKGGIIIAQDEKTSVVWGMPGSVAKAGICNAVLPINLISDYIRANSLGAVR